MPDSDTHPPATDIQGAWSGEVRLTEGPLAGDIHHESWLFADDRGRAWRADHPVNDSSTTGAGKQ